MTYLLLPTTQPAGIVVKALSEYFVLLEYVVDFGVRFAEWAFPPSAAEAYFAEATEFHFQVSLGGVSSRGQSCGYRGKIAFNSRALSSTVSQSVITYQQLMPDHVVVQYEQLHYHGDHSSDRTDRFAHQKGMSSSVIGAAAVTALPDPNTAATSCCWAAGVDLSFGAAMATTVSLGRSFGTGIVPTMLA